MERRDAPLPGIGALGGVVGGLLGGGNGVLTVPALDASPRSSERRSTGSPPFFGTSALLMAVREVVLFVRRRAAVGP